MNLHNDIARKAMLEGEKSAVYRQAAQRHANAFWVYVIVAAIVWWLFGPWWALIPALLACFVALQSVSSTKVAQRLEKHESQSKHS